MVKKVLGIAILASVVGWGVYNANKDPGPLLSSMAQPFSMEPREMGGELKQPWEFIMITSEQQAVLLEGAQDVVVDRFYVTKSGPLTVFEEAERPVDEKGRQIFAVLEFESEFDRRDESGRWEAKYAAQWIDGIGWSTDGTAVGAGDSN